MEDNRIIDLYWARNGEAVAETDKKYGRLLMSVSHSVLRVREDAEECVNDTYASVWNHIPTDRPAYFSAYLVKIVRNISIGRYRKQHSAKRGGADCITDELTDCVPDSVDIQAELEEGAFNSALNRFISALDAEKRAVFILRYFCSYDIAYVAKQTALSEGNVKIILYRLRQKLKQALEKEGLYFEG